MNADAGTNQNIQKKKTNEPRQLNKTKPLTIPIPFPQFLYLFLFWKSCTSRTTSCKGYKETITRGCTGIKSSKKNNYERFHLERNI